MADTPPCFIEENSRYWNLASGAHALSPVEQPLHPSPHRQGSELNRVRPHGHASLPDFQCATKGDNGF
jgi:hypothetical protein